MASTGARKAAVAPCMDDAAADDAAKDGAAKDDAAKDGAAKDDAAPDDAAAGEAIVVRYRDDAHRIAVVVLWRVVFGYDTAHNDPDLAIDRKLAVADDLFFVAMAREAVVGTAMAGYDGHRGWLYSIAVDPAWRRRGIGVALVRHAEDALIRLGCVKINLQLADGNERVAAFYEALGYVVEPRTSMGKRIAANVRSSVLANE